MAASITIIASVVNTSYIEIALDFDGNTNYTNKSIMMNNATVTYDDASETCYVKSGGIDQVSFDNAKAVALNTPNSLDIYTTIKTVLVF